MDKFDRSAVTDEEVRQMDPIHFEAAQKEDHVMLLRDVWDRCFCE